MRCRALGYREVMTVEDISYWGESMRDNTPSLSLGTIMVFSAWAFPVIVSSTRRVKPRGQRPAFRGNHLGILIRPAYGVYPIALRANERLIYTGLDVKSRGRSVVSINDEKALLVIFLAIRPALEP